MKHIFTILFLMFTFTSLAQTCTGKWVTIDDKTGKHKSVVELYKDNGKLYGKIIYLFPREGREDNPKCTKCTDDRKNKPLVGLQIVRELTWNGKEWTSGTIIDPENGKIYKVSLWLNPLNDDVLLVRGYIGILYRTQNWLRLPDKD
ncbi:MAG: hypothetical protein A3D92_02020 [Bacteroidetes bacterium RIFCSPHIGHO2_02_FULL_44_7]|nr:MAG: hypothetical protein A3D92_02020 [Bacteroidetes bacterium RIFCSPHIGHO2_02_FULL_44_7]